jgi:hypothetical protein
MLPSLEGLSVSGPPSIDATLFEVLSKRGVGKKSTCNYHDADFTTTDYKGNCAVDGYLMVKTGVLTKPGLNPADMLGQDVSVATVEGERPMRALLNRAASSAQRLKVLKERHTQFLSDLFDTLCVYGRIQKKDSNGETVVDRRTGEPVMLELSIYFKNFQYEISELTDWYFIDEWVSEEEVRSVGLTHTRRGDVNTAAAEEAARVKEMLERPKHRGHVFVRLFDSKEDKIKHNVPFEGVFADPYLFVIAVCASGHPGFGTYMMEMVNQLAYEIGCSNIALASLPAAAGFYYGKHKFRFADRNGDIVDITKTPWHEVNADGKVLLKPEINVVDSFEKQLRDAVDNLKLDDTVSTKRCSQRRRCMPTSDHAQPKELSSLGRLPTIATASMFL